MFITDAFKQFCKERHAEDKKKNYDTLQEIYANTELFNMSFVGKTDSSLLAFKQVNREVEGYSTVVFEEFKDICLPFANNFIQTDREGTSFLYIREFAPTVLTGTCYYMDNKNNSYTLNIPFNINTENGCIHIKADILEQYMKFVIRKTELSDEEKELSVNLLKLILGVIYNCLEVFKRLPKYSVASDKANKTEYYPRKQAPTIKVTGRPIYYVLGKEEEKYPKQYKKIKPVGTLSFDHSFSVRGHWRRVAEGTIGKNRNGEYTVEGFTWVKEHVRGEGELLRKLRVIK